MTIEEMKARKTELGLTNEMVAEETGLPLGTVQKIFGGATKRPRKSTLDALQRLLAKNERGPEFTYMRTPERLYVKEEATAYVPKYAEEGGYTVEDYFALPDDERVELINGIFYNMAGPTLIHQGILLGLLFQLNDCIEQHEGDCYLYAAPSDIVMEKNGKTVVQPDIYIRCGLEQELRKPYAGEPDFVIEIVSPSSRKHDMIRKLGVYGDSRVREYWIVDPEYKKVIVYLFPEKDKMDTFIYSFEDEVPVGISEGRCKVDFRKVFKRVEHLYE